jgi:ABC-type sugar transport system substrate-binding protein
MLRVRRLSVFTATSVFAVTMMAAGCGRDAQPAGKDASGNACKKTYTIGFSHPFGESEYATALRKKVQAAGVANGCVKILIDTTRAANLEAQRTALENLRKSAQAKGIKWLTYANKNPAADGSVGFDSKVSGELAAKDALAWVAKNYPGSGIKTITAEVTTLKTLSGFAGRYEEPKALFAAAGLNIVSYQDCGAQDCGLQVTQTALRANPNLRVVLGANDDAGLGALKAFKNAGIAPEKVYISGQDGTFEGLKAVRDGGMYRASVAIPIDKLAESIVNNALSAVQGTGHGNDITPTVIATHNDLPELDKLISEFPK